MKPSIISLCFAAVLVVGGCGLPQCDFVDGAVTNAGWCVGDASGPFGSTLAPATVYGNSSSIPR